jgi:hypothetical protein
MATFSFIMNLHRGTVSLSPNKNILISLRYF